MPHPENAPRLIDLEGLALGDIAALPPEMLLDLQTTALAETARVKRLRDRLEAGIAQRYEAAAAAERAAQGKTSGTVRVEDEGVGGGGERGAPGPPVPDEGDLALGHAAEIERPPAPHGEERDQW